MTALKYAPWALLKFCLYTQIPLCVSRHLVVWEDAKVLPHHHYVSEIRAVKVPGLSLISLVLSKWLLKQSLQLDFRSQFLVVGRGVWGGGGCRESVLKIKYFKSCKFLTVINTIWIFKKVNCMLITINYSKISPTLCNFTEEYATR